MFQTDVSCNGFWGHNGHQIAYIGNMALRKGPAALRDKAHREVLIYCVRHLMSNDAKIIRMLKKAVGLNTPDVLSPRDGNGSPVDYCIRTKDMHRWDSKDLFDKKHAKRMEALDAAAILAQCKPGRVFAVDFARDVEPAGLIEYSVSAGGISVKTADSVYETTGMMKTKQSFAGPIRIDACIENKNTAFLLSFNACIQKDSAWFATQGGYLKNENWGGRPGQMDIWDISVMYMMGVGADLPAIETDDIHISWILQRDFMAILVNGVLAHYVEISRIRIFQCPRHLSGSARLTTKASRSNHWPFQNSRRKKNERSRPKTKARPRGLRPEKNAGNPLYGGGKC